MTQTAAKKKVALEPLEPLSAQRNGLSKFATELRYDDSPGRDRLYDGNVVLLDQIHKELLRYRPTSYGNPIPDVDGPSVAELSEQSLRQAVDRTQRRVFPWYLAGDEDQPILERLDAHFRPLQERFIAEAEERIKRAAELATA
jgi:hypothetical protein